MVDHRAQAADTQRQQVLQARADHVERQPEDQQHDADKDRQGCIFVRQHAVDAHTAQMLAALAALDHGFGAQALDVVIAHGGNGGIAVQLALVLHLDDAVLDHLQLVLIEQEAADDVLVALDELRRRKAPGHPGSLRVILDQVRDGVDAAVHRTVITEIHALRQRTRMRDAHGAFDQILNALVLRRGDGNDRNAEFIGHFLHIDGAAVAAHFVHHVERQHHRDLHFKKLQRQIEVALDIRGVDDIDDAVRLLIQDKIAGHDLLGRIGAQGVDTRQIDDAAALCAAHHALLAVDRHAGEIADMLVGPCKLIEQRRFAAILISDQCKDHAPTSGRISICAASSMRSVSS